MNDIENMSVIDNEKLKEFMSDGWSWRELAASSPNYVADRIKSQNIDGLFSGMTTAFATANNMNIDDYIASATEGIEVPNKIITSAEYAFSHYGTHLETMTSNGPYVAITKVPDVLKGCEIHNAKFMFYMATNLKSFNRDVIPVGSAKNMFYMNTSLTDVVLDVDRVTYLASTFELCRSLKTIEFVGIPEVVTSSGYQYTFNTSSITSITGLDVRNATSVGNILHGAINTETFLMKNLQGNARIDYSKVLSLDSLIYIIYHLRDTGSSKTLTIGSTNLAKLASIYVKEVAVTNEMRAEDDLIDVKRPFIQCESTEEGAVLITEYAQLKNWVLQ